MQKKISSILGTLLVLTISTTFLVKSVQSSPGWGADDDWDDFSGSDEKSSSVNHNHHNHTNHTSQSAQNTSFGGGVLNTAGVMSGPNSNFWNEKQGGGLQSGNFAAHNETCGPNRKSCLPNNNLVCSDTDGTGRCVCVKDYVYVRTIEFCERIPRSSHDPCKHDVQCHAGSWGALSRCSKKSATCECYDYHTDGRRQTVRVDDVCYINKTIGDLCNKDEECSKVIRGESYCEPGEYQSSGGQSYNGSCQCRENHFWYKPLRKCLKYATELGHPCLIIQQCSNSTLGKYSTCNIETATCECTSWRNGTEAVYYGKLKQCFLKKAYNDTCQNPDECRASLGPDVECGPTDEIADDLHVCHCPKGKVCRSSAFSNILTSSFTVILAMIGVTISFNSVRRLQLTSRAL